MRVLVTGAEGFVGSHLVPALLTSGHSVLAAVYPEAANGTPPTSAAGLSVVELDLTNTDSVQGLAGESVDAVIHLAAVASGAEALHDPARAYEVNVAGTVRLLTAVVGHGTPPRFIYVSSGEVYGATTDCPATETDPVVPRSPYAASKLAGEVAVLEAHRRTGMPVIVARPFGHTGPGQSTRYVVPAFVERVLMAKRLRAAAVRVGNLEPVREFLHVRDVVRGYVSLLTGGVAGETYNIAGGRGVPLHEVFAEIVDQVGYRVIPEVDATLVRSVDTACLIGDGAKLRAAVGWEPTTPLRETITEIVHAQTH